MAPRGAWIGRRFGSRRSQRHHPGGRLFHDLESIGTHCMKFTSLSADRPIDFRPAQSHHSHICAHPKDFARHCQGNSGATASALTLDFCAPFASDASSGRAIGTWRLSRFIGKELLADPRAPGFMRAFSKPSPNSAIRRIQN